MTVAVQARTLKRPRRNVRFFAVNLWAHTLFGCLPLLFLYSTPPVVAVYVIAIVAVAIALFPSLRVNAHELRTRRAVVLFRRWIAVGDVAEFVVRDDGGTSMFRARFHVVAVRRNGVREELVETGSSRRETADAWIVWILARIEGS